MESQRSALIEVFESLFYIEWFFSIWSHEGNEFPVCCLMDIPNWMFHWHFRLSETSHIIPPPPIKMTSTISPFAFLFPFPILVNGMTLHLVTQIIHMAVILDVYSLFFILYLLHSFKTGPFSFLLLLPITSALHAVMPKSALRILDRRNEEMNEWMNECRDGSSLFLFGLL